MFLGGSMIELIKKVDITLLQFINKKLRCKFLDKIMPYITFLGSATFCMIFVVMTVMSKSKEIKIPLTRSYLKTLKPIERWGIEARIDFSVIPDRELTQSFINWYVNLIETIFTQKEKTFPLADEKEEGYQDIVNYFKRKNSSVKARSDNFYKKVHKRTRQLKAD